MKNFQSFLDEFEKSTTDGSLVLDEFLHDEFVYAFSTISERSELRELLIEIPVRFGYVCDIFSIRDQLENELALRLSLTESGDLDDLWEELGFWKEISSVYSSYDILRQCGVPFQFWSKLLETFDRDTLLLLSDKFYVVKDFNLQYEDYLELAQLTRSETSSKKL